MGDDEPRRSVWADVARYSDLGLRFVIAAIGGAAGGYWLDQRFEPTGRFPLMTLLGLFLGLAVGMFSLFKVLGSPRPSKSEAISGDESGPRDREQE